MSVEELLSELRHRHPPVMMQLTYSPTHCSVMILHHQTLNHMVNDLPDKRTSCYAAVPNVVVG